MKWYSLGSLLLLGAACSGESIDVIKSPSAGAGGAGGSTGGTDAATGGTTGGTIGGAGASTGGTTGGATTGGTTGGSVTAGAAGAPPATGGVGGSAGTGDGSGGVSMGGVAGTNRDPMGGMAGTGVEPMGGMAGTGAEAGGGGAPPTDPYAPRSGPFKVLAYSRTSGIRHTQAIDAGKPMLTAMGAKQGFTVDFTDNPDDVNAANLEQYEVFFGLNPTGNNFSPAQKADFQAWMETKNGGFAGVHSSTDHESGWAFWSDVTGQYVSLHDVASSTMQAINWQPGVENYPFVKGLPSPWSRAEEWYRFNDYSSWSQKPGFKILNLVTTSEGGTRPVSFIREWGNFRSFYTSLGHNGSSYTEPTFVHHVGGGIMWAARREALFLP